MRWGIDICTLGDPAEPERIVELAMAAEAAGWEAVFVWDHLAFAWGVPSVDSWVVLAAMAQATTRIRLGTAVTPLPRRRPAVVASAVATLDRLSGGRVVLGAGIGGVPAEFTAFGQQDDARVRARMLDEALGSSRRCGKGGRSVMRVRTTRSTGSRSHRCRSSVRGCRSGSAATAVGRSDERPVGTDGSSVATTSAVR